MLQSNVVRNRSCPLCAVSGQPVVSVRAGYDIRRCPACGLVFADPLPRAEALDAYYQGFAYHRPPPERLAHQTRYAVQGMTMAGDQLAALSGRPIRRVLDYGGGLGFFANGLADQFAEVVLFDLDRVALREAAVLFPGRFQVVEDERDALAGQYDLILVNQVIEHVPDVVGFLSRIAGACAPGGLVVVTTPNNRSNDHWARPDVLAHYLRAAEGFPIRRLLGAS
jgi:2-polyprenyl-3-methyl-5-hydroxy-6-metoxy-1,4-benzoquinol methylase